MKNELTATERRDFSLRAVGNTLTGHALLFDSLSEDFGGWVEVIRPGALRDVLQDDCRLLVNHDPNLLLGRTRSGTLRLRDDGRGLAMSCELGEQTYAQDLRITMSRGDANQMSFQFDLALDRWTIQPSGILLREILLLKRLYDVSVVVFPAYPATDAGLREKPHWTVDNARKKLELLEAAAWVSSVRNHRSTGGSMNTETRFREQATDQGPHAARRLVLEVMDGARCACGAAAKQVDIDRRTGSVMGRCALHRESRPSTLAEKRLQLDLVEREMRA